MSDPFLGEIRPFAFGYAPSGWAVCDGRLLSIATNQALFSLLGTTFGGDGKTNFALPDLRGRVPMHVSAAFPAGQPGGEESHMLAMAEVPVHTHHAMGSTNSPSAPSPANHTWATSTNNAYSASGGGFMALSALANAGGGQAHPNMQPYLTINFCIATQGIYPPRN